MATKFPNARAVFEHIQSLAKQERFAASLALRDTAYEIRRAEQETMQSVFEGVTPFVLRGVRYEAGYEQPVDISAGAGGALEARVFIDPYGQGKGPSPEQVLTAEVYGGTRGFKGAERRLQAVGLMDSGSFMVPSSQLLEDRSKTDRYGNVSGRFIRSLLSYLQAFQTRGFEANAKARTLARLARRGRTGDRGPERNVRPGYATINGVVYFVSRGPGAGERVGKNSKVGRTQHLPAGIWAKRGIHGSEVFPVFLFVPSVNYRVRLRFEEVARNTAARTFPVRFAARFERALATAR
jgi:hypothetical protein